MDNSYFPTDPGFPNPSQSSSDESPQQQDEAQLEFPQPQQSLPPQDSDDHADPVPVPPVEKPYHSKRPHKKSRAGCRNCKTRKVKCDEVRPTCRSCRLRKVECVYPTPAAPSIPPASTSPTSSTIANHGSSPDDGALSPTPFSLTRQQSPAASDTSSLRPQPLWHPSNIDAVDMKLLWFYTASTSSSFSVAGPGTPVEEILKVRMVQVAFENPFLMDSLFALSSLHMQSLNQECDPSRALAYRARSFEGYRRAVEVASPKTFPALIANSLFLTALSSQVFREEDAKELYILDWMIVWRGIGLVINIMGFENLFETGMSALFERPAIDLATSTAAIPNHLLFMVSSIKPDDPDYLDIPTYHETLRYLGSLYLNLREGCPPTVMGLRIITWFTFLPRPFIELARQRRPRALIIIAYYAAFLKLVTSVWWMEGIGQRSLIDLCKYLGPAWEHLMVVPRAVRDVDNVMEVARVILQDPSWIPALPADMLDPVAGISVVDDAGRPLAWTPHERKIVVLNAKANEQPIRWD